MKKSTRALLGLVLLDLIVVAGAWWMIDRTQSVLLLAFVMHRRAGN